jgi:hypothetical protein
MYSFGGVRRAIGTARSDMPRFNIITREFGNASCELPDGGFTVGRDCHNALVIADSS